MRSITKIFRKLRNIFLKISLIIISCLIAFIIIELYIRIFNAQSIIPRYVDTSPYGIRKNIGNVRGKMITSEYSHKLTTNSQGFRGTKEYSLKKPLNVYRIIVLGDSLTLGYGVEDEETFSAVLEKRLSSAKPSEAINMGVSGFGTAEELIQLREVGLDYNPDLVILAYFTNDSYNNIVSKLFKVKDGKLVRDHESFVPAIFIRDRLYKIPGYSFLSQHSHLLNFIRKRFSSRIARKLAKKNKFITTSPRVLSEEHANLTALLINEIITEVARFKIPLIILNIPHINRNDIFSNLPVDLIKKNDTTYLIDVQKEIYYGYSNDKIAYKNDLHPTPFAHELIAKYLESFIKQKI